MTKDEAKNLVVKTFEQSFDESRFLFFIKNLLSNLNESKSQTWSGNYIPESFKNAIKFYKRIGQYSDQNKNVIDVLIVNVKRDITLERARSLQRNFIARHLKQRNHEAALVAFYTDDYSDWRFSLIVMDINLTKTKVEIDFTPAKRYSFLVGVNERSHTAQNQFVNLLSNKNENPPLDNIEDAFNIETVTKEFFLKYRELFIRIKQALDEVIKNDSTLEAEFATKEINSVGFAKKLLGQIVFLYFLQKKGWFGVEKNSKWGSGSKKFLREIYEKKHGTYNNFFNDILEPLFYEALRIDRSHDDHYYSRFNCKIPFLNGGLFDPIGNYDWVGTDIILPNELFSNIHKTIEGDIGDGILDVFDRYNFTVIEDEPLEKEVAIDPELLGKAYEKFNAIRPDNFDEYLKVLKSGNKGEESKFNKQYGVFYTPREIVHYMCQQSLINYLATVLEGKVNKESIEFLILEGEKFVEHLRTAKEKNENNEDYTGKYKENNHFLELKEYANEIDNLLACVKMCDPAVGSGAFPVGMMSEIVKARMFFVLTNCLDDKYINPHSQKVKRNPYNFKRDCIENSLYGVDIDSGAVEIAKLRLWLSLVVDEDDITNIKPLPNLDYKIVQGDSLIGVEKNIFNNEYFEQLEKIKPLYFNETNPTKKQDYKKQIDEIILNITNGHKDFDFEVYFSEVFHHKDGFDIFIGNPPYIFSRENLNNAQKKFYKKNYSLTQFKINLYILFIEKSFRLINNKGVLFFITPINWLTLPTNSDMRKFLLTNCRDIRIVLNYPNVFESASVDTLILGFSISGPEKCEILEWGKTGLNLLSKIDNQILLSRTQYVINADNNSANNEITNLSGDYILDDIAEVRNGVQAYTVGEGSPPCTETIREKRLYHSNYQKDTNWVKYLDGVDVSRYYLGWSGQYIKYGKNLSRPRNPELFKSERLLVRQIPDQLPYCIHATYTDAHTINDNNSMIIKMINPNFHIKYILAIINSKLISYWFAIKFGKLQRKIFPQFKVNELRLFPINKSITHTKDKIIKLVDKILETKIKNPQVNTKHLENQIDIMVYKLYNLTYEEVKIIDPNIEQIISREEYEKFEIV